MDFYGGVSTSAPDYFFIDELLDFSNDDLLTSSTDHHHHLPPPVTSSIHHHHFPSSTTYINNTSSDLSADFTDHLSVPVGHSPTLPLSLSILIQDQFFFTKLYVKRITSLKCSYTSLLLFLQSDDVAELEWLSQFMEDSFTDFPSTINIPDDTSSRNRSCGKGSRTTTAATAIRR